MATELKRTREDNAIDHSSGWMENLGNNEKPVRTAGLRDLKAGSSEIEAGVTFC